MLKVSYFVVFLSLFLFSACKTAPKEDQTISPKKAQTEQPIKETAKVEQSISKNGLTLTPVQSPSFKTAQLALKSPDPSQSLKPGKNNLDFEVQNFQLGEQTADAQDKGCSNAKEGQSIHLILNNEAYTSHFDPLIKKDLKPGHYVALAFLNRSYNESVKEKGAYVLKQLSVGMEREEVVNLKSPHLFYHHPIEGRYIGAENVKRLLLDFYLINTTLSPDGNKVKATINGTPFLLTKWQAYFIEGLPQGASTIELELVDKDNKPIWGPFNKVKRVINLFKEAPKE